MAHLDSESEGKDIDLRFFVSQKNTHKPLENVDQEIRIIGLLPGEYENPIIYSLEARLLFHEIPYDALSYTWDDDSQSKSVVLLHDRIGKEPKIRRNLESALRHIREIQKPGPIFLWIDSLSINQTDAHEKSHQVRLVREIYQNARNVVVWLGDEDENTVTAYHFHHAIE